MEGNHAREKEKQHKEKKENMERKMTLLIFCNGASCVKTEKLLTVIVKCTRTDGKRRRHVVTHLQTNIICRSKVNERSERKKKNLKFYWDTEAGIKMRYNVCVCVFIRWKTCWLPWRRWNKNWKWWKRSCHLLNSHWPRRKVTWLPCEPRGGNTLRRSWRWSKDTKAHILLFLCSHVNQLNIYIDWC